MLGSGREIHRDVTSGGSFGASSFEQHIGLGKDSKIEVLEVWWPTSKTVQTFLNVGRNQVIEIKEFAKSYVTRKRKSFELPEAVMHGGHH